MSHGSRGVAIIEPDRRGADLLAALRAQDPAVARQLWDHFAPTVFRILQRALGPQAPIEDAVQVVLLCVFHRGRRLRARSDLRQLVMKVTARIARGELRRRAFRWRLSARRPRAAQEAWARDLSGRQAETVRRFYRILDRLSAPDRIAFVLHHMEGLEVQEVAAAIGLSPARTARSLQRSARKVMAGVESDPALRQASLPRQGPLQR